MLHSVKGLEGYTVGAIDGEIGRVVDFYFDDETWVIRYLVVDTGSWLSSRKVLISPMAIDQPHGSVKTLSVNLTREQVRGSPDIDTDKPVSRQHERTYLSYYGYPIYWGGSGISGASTNPRMAVTGFPAAEAEMAHVLADADATAQRDHDPHLRSCKAVIGYHVAASDGEIGHVEDMLVEDQTWSLRYWIVNTSNWWLGHSVLIAPPWIKDLSWAAATVSVDLTREAVKQAPPYDPVKSLLRQQEIDTYLHHGRSGYWPKP